MDKFDENAIWKLYEVSLRQAKRQLSKLSVFCDTDPGFAGLSGWVFEQTIQYCIRKELRAKGIKGHIKEQVSLGGRAKADLTVRNIAVEIKAKGLFGLNDVERYRQYGKAAAVQGYNYVFLTWGESHRPYREGIIKALGKENAFFINEAGEWSRFICKLTKSGFESKRRTAGKVEGLRCQ